MAPHFRSVTATDPSKKMIDIGLQPSDPSIPRIKYGVGSAEDLKAMGIGEGESGVDLILAGQAAHWFHYPKVWREFTKHLRPGGTVAFIGYAEMVFPKHPQLNALISHHARSPEALGNYWQPGRRIVEAYLHPVPFPVLPSVDSSILSQLPPLEEGGKHPVAAQITEPPLPDPEGGSDGFDFSSWDSSTAVRLHDDTPVATESQAVEGGGRQTTIPWLMRKTFTKAQLEGYMRTFSALHSYHEAHPEDAKLKGRGSEGDIVDRFVDKVWNELEKDGSVTEVECGWPLILMMIKKNP